MVQCSERLWTLPTTACEHCRCLLNGVQYRYLRMQRRETLDTNNNYSLAREGQRDTDVMQLKDVM